MAWPNTPYETCTANVTVVHAALATAIQDAINRIINATYSLKSVEIDGTGGAVVVPVAGTVAVSATASGTALPNTTVAWGRQYKEAALFGGGYFNGPGSAFVAGYNVKNYVKVGAGDYTITFNGCPTNAGRCFGGVTCTNTGVVAQFGILDSLTKVGADLVAKVYTWDAAGVAADTWFFVYVWGG